MPLAPVEEVLAALRQGRVVIVADDEARENEGDAVVSAALATPASIAWIVNHSSGFICAPMTNAIADRLDLPMMVRDNEDPRGTAYTVSVDATDRLATGISAADRAHTLNVLADADSTRAAVSRPGHILPLRAVDGGVRARGGHTEAAVDLMKLAGLVPVAAIAEIALPSGDMARLPELLALGAREDVPVTTVAAIVAYLDAHPLDCDRAAITTPPPSPRVRFEVETPLRTMHGTFRVRAYRDLLTGDEHVALVHDGAGGLPIVRVHSECLTGEAFGSQHCECGPQLDAALARVHAEGGAVVYLRGQEGRGIGLIEKLRAYRLQEEGLDTLDANLALGYPADAREYGAAAAILDDLGYGDGVRLLTNNPDKIAQLVSHGVAVAERVPLVVGVTAANEQYLETKRARMGHLIEHPRAARGTERRAG